MTQAIVETWTAEVISKLFSDAFFDTEMDKTAGGVVVKEVGFTYYLVPTATGDSIRIYTVYASKHESLQLQRLELANRINNDLVLVRACVTPDGRLVLDYYLYTKGGTSALDLVLAFKWFVFLTRSTLTKDEQKILA